MGKFKSFTTYTITLIDETPPRNGPHVVCIQEAGESYENAAIPLQRISQEITRIATCGIETQYGVCHVRFIFVADYKFMLIALGMKAANSQNACMYCEQKSVNYYRGGLKWRTRGSARSPGFKNDSLVPCFSLKDTAIDTLHLFFRVTDKLFDLVAKQEVCDDRDVSLFEAELCSVGVKGRLRTSEQKALEFSSLSSRDRLAVLELLCSRPLAFLPAARAKRLQLMYIKFRECYMLLKDSDDAETLRQCTEAFMCMFCAMYQKTMVTPYMHIMVHHAHELVALHKCALGVFNQQSVEKCNDYVKTVYFRCSNFTRGALQVIQRANRVLHAKLAV